MLIGEIDVEGEEMPSLEKLLIFDSKDVEELNYLKSLAVSSIFDFDEGDRMASQIETLERYRGHVLSYQFCRDKILAVIKNRDGKERLVQITELPRYFQNLTPKESYVQISD